MLVLCIWRYSVIQHPRFTSDVFFCAQLFYAPASALPAPDNHVTILFADPRQPRTRCPVSQLWMSVFSQPFGTLPFACDVMFPATHATSHAPESDLSFKASSYSLLRTFGSPKLQYYVLFWSSLDPVRSSPSMCTLMRDPAQHTRLHSSRFDPVPLPMLQNG